MAVIEKVRRGKRVLVIDIRYRQADGKLARLRRDSKAPTKAAAREEEKRILDRIARTGSPYDPQTEPETAPQAPTVLTFEEVVKKYRASFMLTDLKVSTRRGYDSVLDSILLPRFKHLPITSVDGEAAGELDVKLATKGGERKRELSRKTRNNVQIVIRSVLRFAKEKGYLRAAPEGLPRLKPVDETILEIPSDEQVHGILSIATEHQRRGFALMAYAGLRPNEVRALRRRGLLLRKENGEAVGGFLSIREGRSFGQTDTPKTGRREVPIAPPLARILAPVAEGPRDGYVALTKDDAPWGQYGLAQAFDRVRNRAGLAGWSVYALRHYAITAWLRSGIPVHVVQKMAGHKHLATTQRYVHFLKSDLEDAARRLADSGKHMGNAFGEGGRRSRSGSVTPRNHWWVDRDSNPGPTG